MRHNVNENFARRYYRADETTWEDCARRVSENILPESYEYLLKGYFVPSTPILLNAGSPKQSMMACNLIDVADSLVEGERSILGDSLPLASRIIKSGGGIGFNFSELRPKGSPLSVGGVSSGPVSFMHVFNSMAEAVKQGGFRRAAMMGLLNASHPDIYEFITCKEQDGLLSNFNISVTIQDLEKIDPNVWEAIVQHAWFNGEPGVLFLDNINKNNPIMSKFGNIKGCNPCAEMPMYGFESCCLGSINLVNVMADGGFDLLAESCKIGLRFLDKVIDKNNYPDSRMKTMALATRKVGLGVMGFDTYLKHNKISYTSIRALEQADKIGSIMQTITDMESLKLASELGVCADEVYRNATRLTIAPTGHISNVWGVSKSIYPEDLEVQLAMTPSQHLDMMSTWQAHIDNGLSYTVNVPNDSSVENVKTVMYDAWKRGIKCISIYRDESRKNQPLNKKVTDCKNGVCPL